MARWLPDPAAVEADTPETVGRAALVTVTLFALIVTAPLLARTGRVGADLLGSAVMVALVILAGRTRRALAVAVALGVPAIGLKWLAPTGEIEVLRSLAFLSSLALYGFVLALMLRHIFTTDHVGPVTLLMAVNGYLLLGVIWAGAYILCEALRPGSFHGLDAQAAAPAVDLYYFSFVTLTTLGYGDISPLSPAARTLALAEVLCGVMFTGVLVARLIGLYTERRARSG